MLCPRCNRPVPVRGHIRHDGQRWHVVCARDAGIVTDGPKPRGRPRTSPRGAGARQVVVRVSQREGEALDEHARATETTPAELLRRAYFGRRTSWEALRRQKFTEAEIAEIDAAAEREAKKGEN